MAGSIRPALLLLGLAVLNAVLFFPALKGGFFWDDKILISENPYLAGPDFWRTFLAAPFTGPSGWDRNSAALDRRVPFYRPLTALSYRMDLEVWGFNPAAFHLTNLLLQILDTVLFVFVLLRLGFGTGPAYWGGLLFTVFPPHFESVAWISGRTDLLAFAAGAAALLCLLRFREGRRGLWGTLAAISFFLSLLAKESFVLLPGLAFLILFLPSRRWKPAFLGTAVFVPPLVLWAWMRSAAVSPPVPVLAFRTAARAAEALGYYVWRLLCPFRLGLTVDAGRVFGNPLWLVLGSAAAAAIVLSWVVVLRARRSSPAAAAGAAFGLLIAPALAAALSPAAESLLAWRFLYPASGLFVPAVVGLAFRGLRRWAAAAALAVLAVLYLIEISPKVRAYGHEEQDIWLAVEDPESEDSLARLNIGLAWLGKDEERGLAILRTLRGDGLRPDAARMRTKAAEELAAHYTRTKETAKAAPYYQEVFRSGNPPSTFLYLNYAVFLALEGRAAEGGEIVARILSLFPENHLVLLNAARFYAVVGDYGKAAECLRRDYALFPSPQTLEEIRALEILIK